MIADMPIPTMVRSISEAKAHFSAIVDEASGGKAFAGLVMDALGCAPTRVP